MEGEVRRNRREALLSSYHAICRVTYLCYAVWDVMSFMSCLQTIIVIDKVRIKIFLLHYICGANFVIQIQV